MVLADLGRKLNAALSQLNAAPIVDEKVCNFVVQMLVVMLMFRRRSLMQCSRKYVQPYSNQT